jgi:hypothetical protein
MRNLALFSQNPAKPRKTATGFANNPQTSAIFRTFRALGNPRETVKKRLFFRAAIVKRNSGN